MRLRHNAHIQPLCLVAGAVDMWWTAIFLLSALHTTQNSHIIVGQSNFLEPTLIFIVRIIVNQINYQPTLNF